MDLVTGGAGFLGSHLTEALVARGAQRVRVLDIGELQLPDLEPHVELLRGDICDPAATAAACTGVNVLYHTASLVPVSKAGRRFRDVSVKGTRTLYEAALHAGVRKVVHVSSSSVYYGTLSELPLTEESPVKPLGAYGRAKYEAERLCESFRLRGLSVTIVRPRTILGPRRLGILHILYDWIRRGKPIYMLGSGKNLFQLVSARDVTEACLLAATCGRETVYNLGSTVYSTLRKDLQQLLDHAATGSRLVSLPARPTRWVLKLLDGLNVSPLTDMHYSVMDKACHLDITKARRELRWEPRDSNAQMLIQSYEWYLRHRTRVEQRVGTGHRTVPRHGILKALRWLS